MSLDANKALVRRYFEELANAGRCDVAVELLTPEAVISVQQLITMLHTAFPDFRVTIEDQIAEGDKVVTRFTARGTHQGVWHSPLGPIEPTGKQFDHEGIRIFRIANGQLVETWGGADTLRQLQQLGIVPITL
jgi:predicted ester cyclase